MGLPTQRNIWAFLKQFAVNTGGTGNVAFAIIPEGSVQHVRRRCTIAEINTGGTLLNAIPGFKYRMVDMAQISIGGAVGAATTIDIYGVQATATVKLLQVAIAALTQNTKVTAGEIANAAILAGGVSFSECDANTPVTFGKTGASATTATAVDLLVSYILVKV